MISFWGEQKPVVTLVATGFNIFSDFFVTASFLLRKNKKSNFSQPIAAPPRKNKKDKNFPCIHKTPGYREASNRGVEQPGSSSGS